MCKSVQLLWRQLSTEILGDKIQTVKVFSLFISVGYHLHAVSYICHVEVIIQSCVYNSVHTCDNLSNSTKTGEKDLLIKSTFLSLEAQLSRYIFFWVLTCYTVTNVIPYLKSFSTYILGRNPVAPSRLMSSRLPLESWPEKNTKTRPEKRLRLRSLS